VFLDNDYLVTANSVWGVKGNWSAVVPVLFAKPVYRLIGGVPTKVVDEPGRCGEQFVELSPAGLRHVQSRGLPDKVIAEDSSWGRMARGLLALGIPREAIGMFGSRRLGLSRFKDTDFVVYGRDYHDLLFRSMPLFHESAGTTPISWDHVRSQVIRHGALYDSRVNSLEICLHGKWSSCMVAPGICSTIRFVDPTDDAALLFESLTLQGPVECVSGVVQDASRSSFMPRVFTLEAGGTCFCVVTPAWIFHQCVSDGQTIAVTGIRSGRFLFVRDYCHGIRHLDI
jgi:hypothetical protein